MRGEDPDRVREVHQLVLDGVVEHAAEFVGGDADRGEQVGPADVADEQRVAGQHPVGEGVVGVLVHQDADRLRGVAWGFEDLELDVAEGDAFAVDQLVDGVFGLGALPVADPGAGPVGEFQVAGEEVGVEVGVDDRLDGETVFGGVGEVFGDVAARVDDDGLAGAFVGDHVRRLGEAVEVVLGEEHGRVTSVSTGFNTQGGI